jgi:hypothetical protein
MSQEVDPVAVNPGECGCRYCGIELAARDTPRGDFCAGALPRDARLGIVRFGEIDEFRQGVGLLRTDVEFGFGEISRVRLATRFAKSMQAWSGDTGARCARARLAPCERISAVAAPTTVRATLGRSLDGSSMGPALPGISAATQAKLINANTSHRYVVMIVGAGLPANTASILSRASIPIATRVSTVALPICGNRNVFFSSR